MPQSELKHRLDKYRGLFPETEKSRRDLATKSQYHQGRNDPVPSSRNSDNELTNALHYNNLRVKNKNNQIALQLLRPKPKVPVALEAKLLDLSAENTPAHPRPKSCQPNIDTTKLQLNFTSNFSIQFPEKPKRPQTVCHKKSLKAKPVAQVVDEQPEVSKTSSIDDLSISIAESIRSSESVATLPSLHESCLVSEATPVEVTSLPAQEPCPYPSSPIDNTPEISPETFSVLAKLATQMQSGEEPRSKKKQTSDDIYNYISYSLLGTGPSSINFASIGGSTTQKTSSVVNKPVLRLPKTSGNTDPKKPTDLAGQPVQAQFQSKLNAKAMEVCIASEIEKALSCLPTNIIPLRAQLSETNSMSNESQYITSEEALIAQLDSCNYVKDSQHPLQVLRTKVFPKDNLLSALAEYLSSQKLALQAKRASEAAESATDSQALHTSASQLSFDFEKSESECYDLALGAQRRLRAIPDEVYALAATRSFCGNNESHCKFTKADTQLHALVQILFDFLLLKNSGTLKLVAFRCLYEMGPVWFDFLQEHWSTYLKPLQNFLLRGVQHSMSSAVTNAIMLSLGYLEEQMPFLREVESSINMHQVIARFADLLSDHQTSVVLYTFSFLKRLFSNFPTITAETIITDYFKSPSPQVRICCIYLLPQFFAPRDTSDALGSESLKSKFDTSASVLQSVEPEKDFLDSKSANQDVDYSGSLFNTHMSQNSFVVNDASDVSTDLMSDSLLLNSKERKPKTEFAVLNSQFELLEGINSERLSDNITSASCLHLPAQTLDKTQSDEPISDSQEPIVSVEGDTSEMSFKFIDVNADLKTDFLRKFHSISWHDCSLTIRALAKRMLLPFICRCTEAILFVTDCLLDEATPVDISIELLDTLLQFKTLAPVSRISAALAAKASSLDANVRLQCCIAAGKLGNAIKDDQKLKAALLSRLDDYSDEVRAAAVACIGKAKWDSLFAVEALLWVILKDTSLKVVASAINSLEELNALAKYPLVGNLLLHLSDGQAVHFDSEVSPDNKDASSANWIDSLQKGNISLSPASSALVIELLKRNQLFLQSYQDSVAATEKRKSEHIRRPVTTMFLSEEQASGCDKFEKYKLNLLKAKAPITEVEAAEPIISNIVVADNSVESELDLSERLSQNLAITISETIKSLCTKDSIIRKLQAD